MNCIEKIKPAFQIRISKFKTEKFFAVSSVTLVTFAGKSNPYITFKFNYMFRKTKV
jgi:hypothetical protein